MDVIAESWKSSVEELHHIYASDLSRQEPHREIILCCTVRQRTKWNSSLIGFFLPQSTSGIAQKLLSSNSGHYCHSSQPRGLALWKEIIKEENNVWKLEI